MEIRKYTTPEIKKGKPITYVPKGSSKAVEQAKKVWYVEYYFNGKQVRVKGGINRYNDNHVRKQYEADKLLGITKLLLADDLYNPFDTAKYLAQTKKDHTTLFEGIQRFKEYHIAHQSRKKTVATYLSKLNALTAYLPGKLLKDVSTTELEEFVRLKINDGTYSHNSVKSAKRIFSTFFNVMIKLGYIQHNPKGDFDKKIKSTKEISDKHIPYTDTDMKRLFEYLDANDKYTALYCRIIYYTCIRPGEIRGLQIRDINLENSTITIRASVKKDTTNNKNQIVDIDKNLLTELEKLNINQYPKDFYLMGSTKVFFAPTPVGANTPYAKLITALNRIDKLDMIENPSLPEDERIINKGYDLYSFKHSSNIRKYNHGWTLPQIMKANRHGSISMTEIYLKQLGAFTDTKHLQVPPI